MTISEMMLPEFDQEMANTRKLLACVPDPAPSWKPHEKSMTLARLAGHVAELPNWALQTLDRDVLDITPAPGQGFTALTAGSSKELLETCNLHTVLDMPQGTFQGAGVKTVVLVFEKGEATRRIWYYRLNPGRTMGKTTPLNDVDMADFVAKQASFGEGPNSWKIDARSLDPTIFDLAVRNPNAPDAEALRSPGPGTTSAVPMPPPARA